MNSDELKGTLRNVKGRAETSVGGVAGDLGQQAEGALDQIAGGVQRAFGKASDKAEDLIANGKSMAQDARQSGEVLARRAKDHADDLLDQGSSFAREAQRTGAAYGRQATNFAGEHTLTTVLFAGLLGFILGWSMKSSR